MLISDKLVRSHYRVLICQIRLTSPGFYILTDPNTPTTLPSGDYDVPLMIAAKQFNKDGSLFSPIDERTSLYGDVITVNGVPWPFQQVEPRKYKFRLLDASISRSYSLYLVSKIQLKFSANTNYN